jgi:hypothetical protein
MPSDLDSMVDAALRLPDDAVTRGGLRDCLDDNDRWTADVVRGLVCRFPLSRGMRRLSADWFAGAGDAERAELVVAQCEVDAGLARASRPIPETEFGESHIVTHYLTDLSALAAYETEKRILTPLANPYSRRWVPPWCRHRSPPGAGAGWIGVAEAEVVLRRPWDGRRESPAGERLMEDMPSEPSVALRGGWLAAASITRASLFASTCQLCNGLQVGDIVRAKEGHLLASGSGHYLNAVVVSLDPFALVSHDGDMLWHATRSPTDVDLAFRSGRLPPDYGKHERKAFERAARDGYPPKFCLACGGSPPTSDYPAARELFGQHPVAAVDLRGIRNPREYGGGDDRWAVYRRDLPRGVWDRLCPGSRPDDEFVESREWGPLAAALSQAVVRWGRDLVGLPAGPEWAVNRVPPEGLPWG